MRRLIALVVVVAVGSFGASASAEGTPEPSVAALETQVSDLQATVDARGAKINAQRTQIADLESQVQNGGESSGAAPPSSTPAISGDVQWTDLGNGMSFYDYYAEDDYGAILQLGEFRNVNEFAVASPNIRFTLLDSGGNIITTTSPLALSPVIEPNSTAPFQVVLDSATMGEWQSETYEVSEVGAALDCTAGLQLKNVKESRKESDWLEVVGNVLNGGGADVDGISITVAVYRSDGRYAGEISDYVSATVPPGKTAKFDAYGSRSSFPGVDVKPVSKDYTYRIFLSYLPGGFGFYQC
jgi:hypothetical protein